MKRFGVGRIITTCLAIGCKVRKVRIFLFERRDGKYTFRAYAYGKVWKETMDRAPKLVHAFCFADKISLFGLDLAESLGEYRA